MNKVFCLVEEKYANPLFEVFDAGDFVLSSYRDIESATTEMAIYFAEEGLFDEAERRLAAALEIVGIHAPIQRAVLADEDWRLSYRRHFKTEQVSRRIWTHPPWEPMPTVEPGGIVVTLDPGMAFGTGKHETTKACLQFIDELGAQMTPAELRNSSFLDMGAGSGILSIAAAKLGFGHVAGFDIDEEAVSASRQNAAENGVVVDYRIFALGKGAVTLDDSIEAAKGVYPDLELNLAAVGSEASNERIFPEADVVVANILGPLLIAFAGEIAAYAKKTLIVSGILSEIYPSVLEAFAAFGFTEKESRTIGEWTTGLLSR